jgi:hypothetical protein
VTAKRHPHVETEASRWTASAVVGAFFVLVSALRDRYRFLPPWARLAALVLIAAVAVASTLPRGRTRTRRAANVATVALAAILTALLVATQGSLILQIFQEGARVRGASVLATTVVLWAANVVVFALWYWIVDRGGPDRRARGDAAPLDLLFPQNAARELFPDGWSPRFPDYFFLAFVTSTAFSPTDTLPVTWRAKLIMMTQAVLSLATVAMLVARAVNILD